MFLGSLMFLDFHSGDCSDCYLGFDNVVFWVGYWSYRGTAVSVFSVEALFPSWRWSHQHDNARYMGTLLTKFWSLFTTHRQVWNLLFACLLLYHMWDTCCVELVIGLCQEMVWEAGIKINQPVMIKLLLPIYICLCWLMSVIVKFASVEDRLTFSWFICEWECGLNLWVGSENGTSGRDKLTPGNLWRSSSQCQHSVPNCCIFVVRMQCRVWSDQLGLFIHNVHI